MAKKKKKGLYSKIIIIAVIIMNIVFTYKVFELFSITGSEPTTLIGCWFAFTTAELWSLASIKKKKEARHDEEE